MRALGAMLTPTNSFSLLGFITSVRILVKIDQKMRPWACAWTDRETRNRITSTRQFVLFSLQSDIHFINLQSVEEWIELGTAVSVCSACLRLSCISRYSLLPSVEEIRPRNLTPCDHDFCKFLWVYTTSLLFSAFSPPPLFLFPVPFHPFLYFHPPSSTVRHLVNFCLKKVLRMGAILVHVHKIVIIKWPITHRTWLCESGSICVGRTEHKRFDGESCKMQADLDGWSAPTRRSLWVLETWTSDGADAYVTPQSSCYRHISATYATWRHAKSIWRHGDVIPVTWRDVTYIHRRRSDWNSGGRMAGLTIKVLL